MRMMGQEVSDWGQSVRLAETSSAPPTQYCNREEPPPVAIRGSVFCNSNQDTLYQLCPEPSSSKFRHRDTGTNLTLFQYLHFMSHLAHSHPLIQTVFLWHSSIAHLHFKTTLPVKPLVLFYLITKPSPFFYLLYVCVIYSSFDFYRGKRFILNLSVALIWICLPPMVPDSR